MTIFALKQIYNYCILILGGMKKTYLYLDVYFLNSIVVDSAVLLMFCFIMKIQVKLHRILCASLLGDVANCILVIVNAQGIGKHLINIFVTVIMLFIITGKQMCIVEYFIKSIVLFYFIGFMLGGLLTCITGSGCGFIMINVTAIIVMAAVYIVSGERGLSRYRQYNSDIYEVTLYKKNRIYKGIGYYDSGNGVREPLSGALVIIGNITELDSFLTEGEKHYIKLFPKLPSEWDGETHIRGIPYNSLGNGKGMLPGIRIDRLDICKKHNHKTYNNIYVGISLDKLSLGEKYDFILHREMY